MLPEAPIELVPDMPVEPDIGPPDMLEQADNKVTSAAETMNLIMMVIKLLSRLNPADVDWHWRVPELSTQARGRWIVGQHAVCAAIIHPMPAFP